MFPDTHGICRFLSVQLIGSALGTLLLPSPLSSLAFAQTFCRNPRSSTSNRSLLQRQRRPPRDARGRPLGAPPGRGVVRGPQRAAAPGLPVPHGGDAGWRWCAPGRKAMCTVCWPSRQTRCAVKLCDCSSWRTACAHKFQGYANEYIVGSALVQVWSPLFPNEATVANFYGELSVPCGRVRGER